MSSLRFRRRPTRAIIFVTIALFIVALRWMQVGNGPDVPEKLESGMFQVRRIVDGDTLLLESGTRLRLQGVDAPETVKPDHPVEPLGPEASEYTREFLKAAGFRVRVEFGPERIDQYGRALGFVFHEDRMLNEELVRAGLARATTQYHFSEGMKRRLRKAQDEAKVARRGIWSE